MKPGAVLAFALRESRGARGRLVFFAACLALGVGAITGVSSLSSAIEEGIRAQSRELLGADVEVESRRVLPDELDAHAAALPGLRRVDTRSLTTMVRPVGGERSRLVDLSAVGAGYPLYGAVVLDPPGSLDDLGDDGIAVVPELLAEIESAVGARLAIGSAEFTVRAVVVDAPGRLGLAFRSDPRVFVSLAGLERTGLLGFGSRVRHRALFRAPAGTPAERVEAWAAETKRVLPGREYISVETANEAQPTIRSSLARVERFVGLAALLSLLLGGVGVAQIVRAWVASRVQAVAVLRAIGFRPAEVLVLLATHVALLAFVASLAGALLGTLIPFLVPAVASDALPADFQIAWQPLAAWRGTLMGVAIALVFALPPLTAVWRVPPARVLRSEAEPLPAPRAVAWIAASAVVSGVLAAAWIQAESLSLAAYFTGGVAVAAALLALGARGLTSLAARLPRERLPAWLVHGVSALARPGAGTRGAVVALGLGVLVVASTALIEREVAERLRTALPADAPSIFLADVQPDQWPGIQDVLARHGAVNVVGVPVVTARLAAVGGTPVASLAADRSEDAPDRKRWVLTREQRITWMGELPADNRVVEGTLWSDPAVPEVSIEEGFARDLGATLGTRLTFDIQGVPRDLAVTSIRTVEWESFSINFFLVAEPGALDDAPHMLLGAARVEAADEQPFQDELARTYPNVTPLRVRPILERVLDILSRMAVGVRALGLFTILVGLAILAGVASSGAVHRAREVALLKSLGVRRASIAGLFATEYGLLGLVAGLVGGTAAAVLAWTFLEQVIDLGADVAWWMPLGAALGTALVAALCGLLASARALTARPIETLRG